MFGSSAHPELPDGLECPGKSGGRLHRLCGEADPNYNKEVDADEVEGSDDGMTGREGSTPALYAEL